MQPENSLSLCRAPSDLTLTRGTKMNKYTEGLATIHCNLRSILRHRKPMEAHKIVAAYLRKYGKRYSDSSITARLREMHDVKCNLSNYTYSLEA